MAIDNKETKIVKAGPKKTDDKKDAEPKVTVKAAANLADLQTRNMQRQAKASAQAKAKEKEKEKSGERSLQRAPMGTPVVNRDLENRRRPPMGRPVVPKEVAERGMVKEETATVKPDAAAAATGTAGKPAVAAPEKPAAAVAGAPKGTPAAEKPADAQKPAQAKPAASAAPATAPETGMPAGAETLASPQASGRAPAKTGGNAAAPAGQAGAQTASPAADRTEAAQAAGTQGATRPAPAQGTAGPAAQTAARPTAVPGAAGSTGPQGPAAAGRPAAPGGTRPAGAPSAARPAAGQSAARPAAAQGAARPATGQTAARPAGSPGTARPGTPRPAGAQGMAAAGRAGTQSGAGRPTRDGRGAQTGALRGDRPGPRGDRPQGARGERPRDGQGGRTGGPGRPTSRDGRPAGRPDGRRDGQASGGRPAARSGEGRPRSERPGDRPKMDNKPGQRKTDKLHHEKERNKFARLESNGKKNKTKVQERTLEKQARPKKHHAHPKPAFDEMDEVMQTLPEGTVVINVPITVAGFSEQLDISTSQVIMALMRLGIMANINQNIDEETVMVLADELGVHVAVGRVEEEVVEEGLELFEDAEEDLKPRPPIITVMGHVDHGKTSLLDAIRKTNVTASESGGITQHIGASEVSINGQKIVFLDTPGHEAFTAMRARGAHVTDIAVLVVAADDSVMPQTIESISHAKAAGVPIIVAINKMDKPGANPEKVKQDLAEHGVLVEEWGGDVIAVPVSAKTGEGIVNLLEMILLQAEVLELKANPNRLAMGSVIEARLDKNKGPVATLLVTNGTLKSGMNIVAGTCAGHIRLMTNYKGDVIKKAGPATAVEILGLTDVPEAGDEFYAVKEERTAREIAEHRKTKLREEILARNASTTLEQLFSQIKEGEIKDLNLIIKGDVQGSVGAIVSSLEKLSNENVRVRIIHSGVGTVNESDVTLAGTTGSIIIGFNVRPTAAAQALADRENIQVRLYRVIYDIINDVEDAMKGMLEPVYKEEVLGRAEIRSIFRVPGVGNVAGAYVLEGKMQRNAEIRLVRDGIVVHEGRIASLRRFKDDVREVNQGYECGIGIESYNDIKEGDIIECFHMVEIERK